MIHITNTHLDSDASQKSLNALFSDIPLLNYTCLTNANALLAINLHKVIFNDSAYLPENHDELKILNDSLSSTKLHLTLISTDIKYKPQLYDIIDVAAKIDDLKFYPQSMKMNIHVPSIPMYSYNDDFEYISRRLKLSSMRRAEQTELHRNELWMTSYNHIKFDNKYIASLVYKHVNHFIPDTIFLKSNGDRPTYNGYFRHYDKF